MLLPLLHQELQSNQISSLDEATHLADAQTSEISLVVSLSDQASESLLNTRISVISASNNR